MKWLFTSNKSGQEIYELWNTREKFLTLMFQRRSGSLRITTDGEKRVFLVGREGFLRRRTVLRNEYGIKIGQLSNENSQDTTGIIELDERRFSYSIENLNTELVIRQNGERLASCELPGMPHKKFYTENHDILILALCWYLFSVVNRQAEAYA
jgi:hypothetical protein